MGPRPIGRGNAAAWQRQGGCLCASMGRRPIGRGNSSGFVHSHIVRTASMGPRPIGRGNPARGRSLPPDSVCFNGAATDRSRKCPCAMLARSKRRGASMGPRPIGRGNTKGTGAATPSRRLASMGPRPIGRGNAARLRGRVPLAGRFNGAATDRSRKSPCTPFGAVGWRPLQWGRDRSVAEIRPTDSTTGNTKPGFNGAATDRSRKLLPTARARRWNSGLQWGRDRSVAEICPAALPRRMVLRASMGPPPIGRGNPLAPRRPLAGGESFNGAATHRSRKCEPFPRARPRRLRFNGAATDRSRKFAPLGKERHTDGEASMGPRPIGRGNPSAAAPSSASAALQWGRDRSVAEMLVRDEAPGPVAHASMGPRPIGRGNVRIPRGRGGAPPWLQWGRDRSVAEIIPKLDGQLRADLLQWGRDRSVAEIIPKLDGRLRADLIQWGRDRSVAEMVLGGPIDHDERGRLQWGRDRSVAEIQGRWPEGEPAIALQWGRDRSVAEIRTDQGTGRRPAPGASMGPRPIGRGNLCLAGHHPPVDHGFNGAATDRSRKSGITESPYLEAVWASMGPRPIGRGNLGRGV